jgi:hypothetical protein
VFDSHVHLSGCKFPADAIFVDAQFKSSLIGEDCRFFGHTSFDGSHFQEFADLGRSRFYRGLSLSKVTATGYVNLQKATIRRGLRLDSARFMGDLYLDGALILGVFNWHDGNVEGNTSMSSCRIGYSLEMDRTKFNGFFKIDASRIRRELSTLRTHWLGDVTFDDCHFHDDVVIDETEFSGEAWFERCVFHRGASFDRSKFKKYCSFSRSKFIISSSFGTARFEGEVRFDDTYFRRGASFHGSVFEMFSAFYNTEFGGHADFYGARSEGGLTLTGARFKEAPNFAQTSFSEAPRLDDTKFLDLGTQPYSIISFLSRARSRSATKSILARIRRLFQAYSRFRRTDAAQHAGSWRSLKRLAIQGHDHEREQDFFACELMSARWINDMPWHARFIAGVIYQGLSDFGRSLVRPVLWWLLSTSASFLSFMWTYMSGATSHHEKSVSANLMRFASESLRCQVGEGDPIWSALHLAIRKGLLFVGLDADEKLNQIYACLYGIHNPSVLAPRALPADYTPIIPDTVHTLGLIQTLVSAVLIFLFLLAVRNHFRIR